MTLPLIFGIGSSFNSTLVVGNKIHNNIKMKEASDTLKLFQRQHDRQITHHEATLKTALNDVGILGKKELEILTSLRQFSIVFERLQNRPDFEDYIFEDIKIPAHNVKEIQKVSTGADMLLCNLGKNSMVRTCSIAIAGATTAAIMAVSTASIETVITSLSEETVLGNIIPEAVTTGVELMIGEIVFTTVGVPLSGNKDIAYEQLCKEQEEIEKACKYLLELSNAAKEYTELLLAIYDIYLRQLIILTYIVYDMNKRNWNDFSKEEKLITENTALLVALLYNMGKVELVLKSKDDTQANTVNKDAIQKSISDAYKILFEKGFKDEVGEALDWKIVKEILHSAMTDAAYYKWIDILDVKTDKTSVTILAPYKEAIVYIKAFYQELIEKTITQCLNRKIVISYEVIEQASNESTT